MDTRPPSPAVARVATPRRGPRSRWIDRHRRLAWGLGIGSGSLLLLLLVGWLALPYLVRAYVLERLEKRFGVVLEPTEVDAGFGSVRLEGVTIRSAATGMSLARCRSIRVEVSLWALIRGRIGVERMEVDGPEVVIAAIDDAAWSEVLDIVRRAVRGGKRLAGGSGGGAPEVVVRDLGLHLAYRGELVLDAAVPLLRLGGDRRLTFRTGAVTVGTPDAEVARLAAFEGTARLAEGRLRLETARVSGGRFRWSRGAGEAVAESAALRLARALRHMARTREPAAPVPAVAAAPVADAGTAAPSGPRCAWPVDGTVAFDGSVLEIADPRLRGAPLRSEGVAGSVAIDSCAARLRVDAAGDGRPAAGGWEAWLERSPVGLSGGAVVASGRLDELVQRLLPGHALPEASGEGPVEFVVGRRPGESAVTMSGTLPVPELSLAAAGRVLRLGPERVAFEARVGWPKEGRLGLAGKLELHQAAYREARGETPISRLAVTLAAGTEIPLRSGAWRVVAELEAEPAAPILVSRSLRLEAERFAGRADLTFERRKHGDLALEGSFQAAGLRHTERNSPVTHPVLVAGAFDSGTQVNLAAGTASIVGRILADGLRLDRRRLPLTVLGPPGIELALELKRGVLERSWIATGSLGIRGVTVDSAKVAREPLTDIAVDLSGTFTLDVGNRELTLEQGRARVGGVETALSAAATYRDGTPAVRVAVAGSHVACQDLLDALPAPLRADLPGLEFGGSVDFHVALDLDFADLRSTEFDLDADSRCRVTAADTSLQMQRLQGTFRHQIVLPDGSSQTIVTGPGSEEWTSLADISPYLVMAVLTTEDRRFFEHSGVSIRDLRAAIVRDIREGRFAYGGSTIDMQVVKNVFLDREKTVARKVQELILTWWMDQALDKPQILELYLNVIEYGPALYGIRAAAMHYFGRTPADLSPLEAIFLAKLLPDPITRHGMWIQNAVSAGWRRRLDRLLGLMFSRGDLSEEEYQAAIHDQIRFWHPGEPLPEVRYVEAPGMLHDPWETVIIGGEDSGLPVDPDAAIERQLAEDPDWQQVFEQAAGTPPAGP